MLSGILSKHRAEIEFRRTRPVLHQVLHQGVNEGFSRRASYCL